MSDPVQQADNDRVDAVRRGGLRRWFGAWRIRRRRAEQTEAHDPTDSPDRTDTGWHKSGQGDAAGRVRADDSLPTRPVVSGGTASNWIRVYDSDVEVDEDDLECLRASIASSWWEYDDSMERVYRLTTDDGRTLDMPLPGDQRRLAVDSSVAVYRRGEQVVAIDVRDSDRRGDGMPPGPDGVLRQWFSTWCDSLHWILLDSPNDQAEQLVYDAEQLPWCIGAWVERHPYGTLLCLASKHLPAVAVEPVLVEIAERFGGTFDGSETLRSHVPRLDSESVIVEADTPAKTQLHTGRAPIMDGTFTEYHPNGQRKCRGTRDQGRLVGDWKAWFEDGTLRESGRYREGKKSGTWQVRDSPDGPVRTERH